MTDPIPNRALIVIDVQNDYDGGNLAITYPPFGESIDCVAQAIDAANANGVKVVVVKMILPETAPVFAKGSHGGDLHPAVASRAHDHYVEKTLPSAFTGTDLEDWLHRNLIDTVTVIGYMTHNCDLSTVVHALHMGFNVEVLSDATGAVPYANAAGHATAEEIHRVMLVVMQARFAAVLTTDDWVAGLKANRLPPRDNIYSSYQRALTGNT